MENISLGEKVFILSEAGQKPLYEVDFKEQDFVEATIIYERLRDNEGKIDLEKEPVTKEKPVTDKTISLEDVRANFDKLSREEQSSVLESMDNLKAANQKTIKEEGFKRLPSDLQATLGMSPENLAKLTEDQRTILVKQFDDILIVETKVKKKKVLAEAIK